MQLTRFRVVILLILAVSSSSLVTWHFVSAISQPNSIISPGSFINTATYTIWNNAGTYQAKDDTGNSAALTGTDIGILTNNVLAACPTVTNAITGRSVPECRINYRNSPGFYNGTTTITVYSDWFVALIGENPCALSIQNFNTIKASVIDIESTGGVLVLQRSPNEVGNTGGGTIDVENLCFASNTSVTVVNGLGPIVGLGIGASLPNAAKVIVRNVGVADYKGGNTVLALRSIGNDDIYEIDNVYAFSVNSGAQLVYIAVTHFNGRWLSIQSQNDVSACPGTCVMLDIVPNANFYLDGVHEFGTTNAWLNVEGGSCTAKTIQLFDFFAELATPPHGPGIDGGLGRAKFGCSTVFGSFGWGNTFNPLNNTNIELGTVTTLLGVFQSQQFDNIGLIKRPFGALICCSEFTMGTAGYENLLLPAASTAYLNSGSPIWFCSTGGTGVSITIKDGQGNTVSSGQASISCTTPYSIPTGWTVNWGAYSVAPTTVSVFSGAW